MNDHVNEKNEWMEYFFNALTSKTITRNKNFDSFSNEWSKLVFKRFRTVCALKKDAERLVNIPGTFCRISRDHAGLLFQLECPRLRYRREVALQGFEWKWLGSHPVIQTLLEEQAIEQQAIEQQAALG